MLLFQGLDLVRVVILDRGHLVCVLLAESANFLLILCLHISSLFLQSLSFSLEPFSCRLKICLELLYFLLIILLHELLVIFEFLLEFFDHILILTLLLIEFLVSLSVLALF